ncbi:MAG TPA: ROK family protein, partial [bacterium]|nr:ROK family protein [bacterium]
LFTAARTGDMAAEAVIRCYGRDLGRLIAAAAIAWSVRTFILGGGISAAWEQFKEDTFAAIDQFGFSPLTDNLSIRTGILGDRAGLIGAASLVLNTTGNRDMM